MVLELSKEEIINSATHCIGLFLSVIGTIYYCKFGYSSGSFLDIFCAGIFGLSLILLYLFSTLYHFALPGSKFKTRMQRLDHSAIYLLIAGSYTPIMVLSVGGTSGFLVLVIVWVLGLLGIYLEMSTLMKSKKVSLTLYLAMGWAALFVIKNIYMKMPSISFILLVLGGLFYTVGVYFYVQKSKQYFHAVWHVFVLLGSFSHYLSILIII